MYDLFWEPIPGFDRSEVEKHCLESSHVIFGCSPYQLVVAFSKGRFRGLKFSGSVQLS